MACRPCAVAGVGKLAIHQVSLDYGFLAEAKATKNTAENLASVLAGFPLGVAECSETEAEVVVASRSGTDPPHRLPDHAEESWMPPDFNWIGERDDSAPSPRACPHLWVRQGCDVAHRLHDRIDPLVRRVG